MSHPSLASPPRPVRRGHPGGPGRRAPVAVAAAVALTLGIGLAACGGSSAPAAVPVLRVVATNFALNELVRGVGGTRVAVTDLATGAPDDRTMVPRPAQTSALKNAALVVEVGGGWQPSVEEAAGTGPRVLALGHQGSAVGAQVWLDPTSMESAARVLEAKLVAIDPLGQSDFANGLRDFNDNLASVAVDYQSSLAACQYHALFTPDSAFAAVAARYALQLHVVSATTGASGLAAAVTAAGTQSFHAIFAEPPLASSAVRQFAAQGKAKVGELDTMDGPPIRTEPATSTYDDRLEANLKYLTGGLYCQDNSGLQ